LALASVLEWASAPALEWGSVLEWASESALALESAWG
jgi:hypothetical protein